MKTFYFILALVPLVSHAQFELVAKQEADASVTSFLQDVTETLPLSLRTGINKKVFVDFRELSHKNKVVLGQVVAMPLAKKNANTVTLHKNLLKNIQSNENYKLAKATLLHEISHIYDFQNLQVGLEKELKIRNKNYTISDSPVFLNIAGWKKSALTRRLGQTNKMQQRRVDVYEDKSPQETFAVNVEHFLMDPEFKCRKPGMYEYLAKSLDHKPFENDACEMEYRLAPSINVEGNAEKQKVLDPSRLFEVHYFFAGQGKNIMSRWGHAMLRLVMCAPHRKTVDEKCLQDRAHHLILSFRADITNFNIDYIKGMTGKYSSKMFVLSMTDVLKEYNVGELRDLYSIPLNMNNEQKERLVSQVLERYWGYESKYYFITNNCADETLNLLKNVYPEELKIVDMNVLTPLGIRKKFEKLGIADMSVFDDITDAKKKGYFFEGLNPKLERIFTDLVQQGVLTEKDHNHENYLDHSTIESRGKIAEDTNDPAVLGKLVFIEETIIGRKLLAIQKRIGEELNTQERSDKGGKLIDLFHAIQEARQKKNGLDLSRGYGIPQVSDEIFGTPEFSEEDEEKLKRNQAEFTNELQTLFAREQSEVFEAIRHKQKLLNKLVGKK